MANSPRFYAIYLEAGVDAFCAQANSGKIEVYSGSQPAVGAALSGTLLVTLTLSSTAFGGSSASAGTVTATGNTVTGGTAVANGTAGYFALEDSGGNPILTGSVGTSGTDMVISTTTIVTGGTVTCSSLKITQSQS